MVSNSAVGIGTTQPGTRVLALLVDAGLVRRALGIDDALWPAVWRGANHLRQAGALTTFTNGSGRIAVGSAWVRVARIDCLNWLNS